MAENNPEVNVERTNRTEFFKRHLRVIAALGIAFVVISAGTVTYVILKPDAGNVPADQAPPGTGPDKAGQAYEVLPETKRPLDPVPEETPKRKQVKDPFIGPLELAGVILGGRGGNLAIIEAGDAAYVVSEGDLVQSVWTVSKIDKDTVLLTAGEQQLTLSLAGRR